MKSKTTKGVEKGMHMVNVNATLFQNFLYSCPRHEQGEPPGHSLSGTIRRSLKGQAMTNDLDRWCTSWSCLQARLAYPRRWRTKDYEWRGPWTPSCMARRTTCSSPKCGQEGVPFGHPRKQSREPHVQVDHRPTPCRRILEYRAPPGFVYVVDDCWEEGCTSPGGSENCG